MTHNASHPASDRGQHLRDSAVREAAGRRADSEHFDLELECDSDPISGALTDGSGLRRRFAGWLQLMSILDRAKPRATTNETAKQRKP